VQIMREKPSYINLLSQCSCSSEIACTFVLILQHDHFLAKVNKSQMMYSKNKEVMSLLRLVAHDGGIKRCDKTPCHIMHKLLAVT